MSGEMPTYLGQYVTGSISYTAALITRLKKERYISLRCKDGYRGYVLLEKGRNYLLSEYEKELSFFISGSGQTGHVKSEPEKRMRLYRMSEVWVFFWKAGIEILRNHKPDMDKGFVRDRGGDIHTAVDGFAHSETPGSKDVCSSPGIIAACRVLHRLPVPRHPPCARGILRDRIGPAGYPRVAKIN